MKKFIVTGAVALLFVGVALVPQAKAQETSVLEQIEALMAQLVELQSELAKLQGDIRDVIKDGLAEGMTDDDIAKVQELLATDPDLYPEGLVTGYFGPLTKKALKRFQERHQVAVTGEIDGDTKGLLEAYFGEAIGDVPPGFLRAPGIAKKIEIRYKDDCTYNGRGWGAFCKKLKIKYEDEDGDDDDSDDDSNDDDDDSSDDGFDVEVEIEDGEVDLEFTFDGHDYDLENIEFETIDDIINAATVAVNEENGTDGDLDAELAAAIEAAYDAEVLENEEEAEAEAMEAAEEAMEDAQDDIDDAQDEIDDADAEGDDTIEAVAKLDEAKAKLADAQTKFSAEDYVGAEEDAEEASDLAKAAENIAEDAEPLTP